jgi:hypothetical protein
MTENNEERLKIVRGDYENTLPNIHKELSEEDKELHVENFENLKKVYEGIKLMNDKLDSTISNLDNPIVKANSTATVEERLSLIEKQILMIQQKDVERDRVIDHLAVVTTRLEAKVSSIQKHMDISLLTRKM